ncbi:CDGSH iron-sulfur domain-containing protein [Streptomyces sp. DW26H14]|uniref:CDGSH iron-sulfur domain-containing protein n=1 Tax=Streptomyces sp. DW26H14 TaxID=3435395 RepID=UPI00403DF23A
MEGPVEVTLGDGSVVRSDRPAVAVCTCRRSRRYPWCDTSHRRRSRQPRAGASGTPSPSPSPPPAPAEGGDGGGGGR